MAQRFYDTVSAARRALPLPPVRRDPALDEPAKKALDLIADGVPDDVTVVRHLEREAPLAGDLQYGVGFEARTPGVDEGMRQVARRVSGTTLSEPLLAADPALDAIGWAASGPWSVAVLRSRHLLRA